MEYQNDRLVHCVGKKFFSVTLNASRFVDLGPLFEDRIRSFQPVGLSFTLDQGSYLQFLLLIFAEQIFKCFWLD